MAEITKKLKLTSSSGVSEDIKLYNSKSDIPTTKSIAVSYSGGTAYAPVGSDDSSSWSKLVTGFGKVSKEAVSGFNVNVIIDTSNFPDLNSSYVELDYDFRFFRNPNLSEQDTIANKFYLKEAAGNYRIPEGNYEIFSSFILFLEGTPQGNYQTLFTLSCSGGVSSNISNNYRIPITVTGDGTITIKVVNLYTNRGINLKWIVPYNLLPSNNNLFYTSPKILIPYEGPAKLKCVFTNYDIYTTPFHVLFKSSVNGSVRDSISKTITPAGQQIIERSTAVNYSAGEYVELHWSISNLTLIPNSYPVYLYFGNYV